MENLKLVDAFTDFVEESTLPYRQMMTYYNCALMEVETKFKVLNEQFSLFYDRNPIESIHTRIKSQSSILKKLQKKNLALTDDFLDRRREKFKQRTSIIGVAFDKIKNNEFGAVDLAYNSNILSQVQDPYPDPLLLNRSSERLYLSTKLSHMEKNK